MNTIPFPYHRYEMIRQPAEKLVPTLQHVCLQSIALLDDPRIIQMVRDKYTASGITGMNQRDDASLLMGGWLENVQIAYLATRGVVLHIDDMNLLKACEHSSLPDDACLPDLALPYPAIEIRFHKDSGIAPCIYLDLNNPDYLAFVANCTPTQGKGFDTRSSHIEGGEAVIAVAADTDEEPLAIYGEHVRHHDPVMPQLLASTHSLANQQQVDKAYNAFRTAVIAMMLRWEEVQEKSRDRSIRGLPATLARTAGRRRTFRASMPRLYTNPTTTTHSPSHDGHEVTGHWRRAHFRTLLHSRYKRGEDGRPKVIFVAVTAIKGGGRTEKKL